MWFNSKAKNRRTNRSRDVLDVKLRSSQRRAVRTRRTGIALGACLGSFIAIYLLWRAGSWSLNQLVYENKSFAIQQIDVVTDGVGAG